MKRMIRTICFMILLFSCKELLGQEESIQLLAKPTETSIKLRWAPTTPIVWHYANEYGYTIERHTLARGNQLLDEPIIKILTSEPIKPSQLPNWEEFVEQDDYVAIAAQAIYGERFEVTETFSSEIVQAVNKAREMENRFSFALFAVDMSLQSAKLSGLYYEDEEVFNGEKYLYRVYANIPATIIEVDTAFRYLGLDQEVIRPPVQDVEVKFADQVAQISWRNGLDGVYNSFWVERASSDLVFERVNAAPLVGTFQEGTSKRNRITLTDSLSANGLTFHYRVVGIDAFGDTGPPSDTVSGQGLPGFTASPAIVDHELSDESKVLIKWDYPGQNTEVKVTFSLLREDPTTHHVQEIASGIDGKERRAIDLFPASSNYYIIRAIDQYGRTHDSFPYLVQLEDSIPPAIPVGLEGRIDTSGHVFLNWEPNPEGDLDGYKLFRSNFPDEQFIQLPGPIIKQSSYVDTISSRNLTENIYYRLKALDRRYNASDYSSTLVLEKPDLIPPVSPVITAIRSDSTGISLSWERSSSEDVVRHLLYRRSQGEMQWTLIKDMATDQVTGIYHDQNLTHKQRYAYTMIAVDDDGLESAPSRPLSVQWNDVNAYPSISDVYFLVDREQRTIKVTWNYDMQHVMKFQIYRSDNEGPLALYKEVDSEEFEFIDQFSPEDRNVKYGIMASFPNGEKSSLSDIINVQLR